MEDQTVVIETTAEEIRTETAEPQASDSTAIVLDTQTDEKEGLDFKSTLVGGIVVAAAGGLVLGVKAIVTKVKKAKKDKADFEAWKADKAKAEEEATKEQQEEKEEPKQEQETSKEEEKSEKKDEKSEKKDEKKK